MKISCCCESAQEYSRTNKIPGIYFHKQSSVYLLKLITEMSSVRLREGRAIPTFQQKIFKKDIYMVSLQPLWVRPSPGFERVLCTSLFLTKQIFLLRLKIKIRKSSALRWILLLLVASEMKKSITLEIWRI